MSRFKPLVGVTALALIAMVEIASTPPSIAAEGENMLYLVEFAAAEAGAPTTRQQTIELLGQLIVPSLESLAKEGKIRAGGIHVGARAGVFIVAAKSNDEVTEFVRALPAWGVWKWKVTPLESLAHGADLEKKVVQQLSAEKRRGARITTEARCLTRRCSGAPSAAADRQGVSCLPATKGGFKCD